MNLWQWLGSNAGQIQALAGIAAVIVAGIVGWVGWKQKQAAEAQVRAADKQAAAAEAQTQAAREQIRTSLLIADIQSAPNIRIESAELQGASIRNAIQLRNIGNGTALRLNVLYQDGLPGHDDLRLPADMLASGETTSFVIDPGRAAQSGINLHYETLFETDYILAFRWNGQIGKAVNLRLTALPKSGGQRHG